MIMRKLHLFLLFTIIVIGTYQQCSQTAQTDLLQSGSTFFFNANGGANVREHIFQFPINFSPPNGALQVIASSSNFQISSSSGVNFQIIGGVGQTSAFGTVLLLIGEDSSWTSVRVYYLASSRSDFFLGTFSADVYLLQKYSAGNSVSISYVLPGWTSTHESFTAITQISGLRTTAPNYSVAVGALNFDSVSGLLINQLTLDSTPPIESITISYIIFKTSAPFGFSSFNVMTGSSATYQFIGIGQLTDANTIYAGSALISQAPTQGQLNCIGSNCPSQCLTGQNCMNFNGQVIDQACFLCGQGQIAQNGTCQTISPKICGPNQYYNGTDCACFMGYLQVNTSCFQGCGLNAYINNSQCICLPGYTYSANNKNCIKSKTPVTKCGPNYVLIKNVCVCTNGFGLINNLCVRCPPNSYVDSTGLCKCNSGLSLSSSTLTCIVDCFPNSYRNIFGQCVCNNGFYNTGNSCVAVSSCVNGQIWNGTGCSCPQGQITDSITQQCTYCNTADRMVSVGSCICSPTNYPTNIGCSPCPSNSLYNLTAKVCQCVTGYYMQNGVCVLSQYCPPSSVWNAVTLQCDCTSFGQYVINGFCQSCNLNSKWNGTACACNTGFVANGPLCGCPANSVWNGTECACKSGYLMIGTACTQCDVNAVYLPAQKTCVCKAGWFGTYNQCSQCDPTCATCSGPGSNQCVSCSGTRIISNGICILNGCSDGQYLDSNHLCQPCMAHCSLCNGAISCTTCASGYSLNNSVVGSNIVASCQPIPVVTSSTLTLKGQVVGNGLVYQGVAMSLMPTAILANGCTICNSLLTVKVISSFTTVTTSIQYLPNSQFWFAVTFNFGATAFIPTFQFNIQINPAYASYFSSADMAQQLTGTGGGINSVVPSTPAVTISSAPSPSPSPAPSPSFTNSVDSLPNQGFQAAVTPDVGISPRQSNLKGGRKTDLSPSSTTPTTSIIPTSSTSSAPSSPSSSTAPSTNSTLDAKTISTLFG